jgi:hypothetical protein
MMSKIEQVKAELASARQKYVEYVLNPVEDYGYDWEGSKAGTYSEEIREKLEKYVILLEAEVESLKVEVWGLQDEIRSGPFAYLFFS